MKLVLLEKKSLGDDVDISAFHRFGELDVYVIRPRRKPRSGSADADIVLVNKVPMNEKTLGRAGNLKLLCVTATGTNIVDMDYCRKRGIAVANVAGYSTHSVAQHTFALLFYVLEKLSYYDSYVKSGAYCGSPMFTHIDRKFYELRGKVWGTSALETLAGR